jgi:glycosyltransferase involved in cell wall biosynthesis/nicotinamidase-related amidase
VIPQNSDPASPLISLVLPVKNGMPHIQLTIEALRRQTYRNFEVLVQDGGSTDDSLAYLRSVRDLPAIEIVSERDRGIGQAYNRGIQRCRGDLLCLIAADECLDDDALQKGVDWYRVNPDAVVIYPAVRLQDATGRVVEIFVPPSFDLGGVIRCEVFPTTTGFIHKKNIGDELYYDETLKTTPDYEFWIRIGAKFGTSKILSERTPIMTARADRTSMSYRAESFDQFCKDRLTILNRFIGTLAPGPETDELLRTGKAGIFLWAAEKLFSLEGVSDGFLKWCAAAAPFDPDSPRLRKLALESEAFEFDPAGRFQLKQDAQPQTGSPGTELETGMVSLNDLYCQPHWPGASARHGWQGFTVTTGDQPWSYAAEIPLQLAGRLDPRRWYWACLDLQVLEGQIGVGLDFDGDIFNERLITPADGAVHVPIRLNLSHESTLMIRNGSLPVTSVVEVLQAAVKSCPKVLPEGDTKLLHLNLRSRRRGFSRARWFPVETPAQWPVSETAILIIDMWDSTWCRAIGVRAKALVPRIAAVVDDARQAGLQIIHAPSDTMACYKEYPQRLAMMAVERVVPPPELPAVEVPLPFGPAFTSETGDTMAADWTGQEPEIPIGPDDRISDEGIEIYSFLRQRGIRNLIFIGVHANLCILDRSFGLKQMSRWGIRCALVRDLTDVICNPKEQGLASRDHANELVIEYIEKYWCATLTSRELTQSLQSLG